MNLKILIIVFMLTPLPVHPKPGDGRTMYKSGGQMRTLQQHQYRQAEQRSHHRQLEERNRQTQFSPYDPNQQQFQGQLRPLQLDWDKILENF